MAHRNPPNLDETPEAPELNSNQYTQNYLPSTRPHSAWFVYLTEFFLRVHWERTAVGWLAGKNYRRLLNALVSGVLHEGTALSVQAYGNTNQAQFPPCMAHQNAPLLESGNAGNSQ